MTHSNQTLYGHFGTGTLRHKDISAPMPKCPLDTSAPVPKCPDTNQTRLLVVRYDKSGT